MSECDVYEIVSGFVPQTREKYTGDLDRDNQSSGHGYQTWEKNDRQNYLGEFLQNNLHGLGKYFWLRNVQSYMYEGSFYANNFEGYANITYTDGKYFEGLMKNNHRYGPGVLTYTNGTQDVGIWDGVNLRRLSCVVLPGWVPRLARSSAAKVKLLKYRKLVPICPEVEDIAKRILENLNVSPELLSMSDKLYNKCVRNPNSQLFNKKLYNSAFFGEADCSIDVVVSSTEAIITKSSESNNLVLKQRAQNDVGEAIEELLENVEIKQQFDIVEREFIPKDVFEEKRTEIRLEKNARMVQQLVGDFLCSIDELLSYSKDERILILNKVAASKILPKEAMSKENFPTKQVVVSDLLAWNNEDFSIDMMKHTFLHRNKENIVSFNVGKLLAGDRLQFNKAGEYEKLCVSFLNDCSIGSTATALKLLRRADLNPDICDARGNSGMTFAASRDRWKIIKMLTNFGGNVDILNDEGLTPLTICILRYLCVQHDIGNWEQAFLSSVAIKPEEERQVGEWRPHISFTNMLLPSTISLTETVLERESNMEKLSRPRICRSSTHYLSTKQALSLTEIYEEVRNIEIDLVFRDFQESYADVTHVEQPYLFTTKCIIPVPQKPKKEKKPPKEKKEKKKGGKKKDKSDGKASSETKTALTSEDNDPSQQTNDDFVKLNKLKIIHTTIKVLLSCGADPNIGQVPMPALILSVFTNNDDIELLLLEGGANPNMRTIDENVTCLHILASLPFNENNFKMFKALLEYGADSNCKTNTYHWLEEKDKIVGKRVLTCEDMGKTPLQILCMRYDFLTDAEGYLQEYVKLLIEYDALLDEYYLGHTPFSLAVLRGNLKLVQFLLDTNLVDPNLPLGEEMGVALTLYILKRYANILPLETCQNMYDLLLAYNVNPLNDINEVGNAVEFMDKEYEEIKKDNKKADAKTKKKASNKDSSKSSKKSKKGKQQTTEEIKNYLTLISRKTLERNVQSNALKYITNFILLNVDDDDEIMETLATFNTLDDCHRIIQLFISKGILSKSDSVCSLLLKILQIVHKNYAPPKNKKNAAAEPLKTPEDIMELLDWKKDEVETKFGLIEPEIDPNKDKYKVCFYCCRKLDKILIPCPKCGLIYFCSEECNKISNKEKGIHKCGVLFYNKERKKMDDALKNGLEYKPTSKLDEKLDKIREMMKERGQGDTFDPADLDGFGSLGGAGGGGGGGAGDFVGNLIDGKVFGDKKGKKSDKKKHHGDKDDSDSKKKGKKSKDGDDASTEGTGKSGKRGKQKKGKDKDGRSIDSADTSTTGKGKRDKGKKGGSVGTGKGKKGGKKGGAKGSASRKGKSEKGSKYSSKGKQKGGAGGKSGKGSLFGQDKKSMSTRMGKQGFGFGAFGKGGYPADGSNYPRLSNKYQYFMEKLSEFFPDFDLSMLFMPYVCYYDGQLYYRFLDEKPVFIETYSNV